jgi:hypothetical protein
MYVTGVYAKHGENSLVIASRPQTPKGRQAVGPMILTQAYQLLVVGYEEQILLWLLTIPGSEPTTFFNH